eukprot:2427706-Rhodomonas_salina.1
MPRYLPTRALCAARYCASVSRPRASRSTEHACHDCMRCAEVSKRRACITELAKGVSSELHF